jgi:eukaryotic-like serine/threonine-protein kinase
MFRGGPSHVAASDASFFRGQGGVLWRAALGGPVRSTPAVTARQIFVGADDGMLYAVDRSSGRISWRVAAGAPVSASPLVANGLVVAATTAGRIVAVDQSTGALRWEHRAGAELPTNDRRDGWDFYASSPVAAGGTLVIGSPDGRVSALDLKTGADLWHVQTNGRVTATPAVADGLVVVGSWDGRIYALDLATGRERWVFHTIGDTIDLKKAGFDRRAIQSSAAIAGGMVFVGSRDDGMYAIDARTGHERWRVSHQLSWVVGSPAVRDGRVYVGTSDGQTMEAMEAGTGRMLWQVKVAANVLASPVALRDVVLFATIQKDAVAGDLIALDARTGAERWRLRLDDEILSSPVAAGSEVYVGTDAGSLYAIHETNRQVPKLAVYYDSSLDSVALAPGARLGFEYFRDRGYQVLTAKSLPVFLTERIADGVPSVVVFVLDVLPRDVSLRPYLDAGGKVVWLSSPLGFYVRDRAYQVIASDSTGVQKLLGVPSGVIDFTRDPASPTAEGRQWGLDRVERGLFPVAAGPGITALNVDRAGHTTAWVHTYRADRAGSGYVQLWGYGTTIGRLEAIRQVAEYGLLR